MLQLLRRGYMFFKSLTLGRVNTRCRDQRHRDWLPGSLIHGFVARCGTGARGLVRRAVILKTDAVILEECRALHNRPRWPRHNTIWLHRDYSTVISAASC